MKLQSMSTTELQSYQRIAGAISQKASQILQFVDKNVESLGVEFAQEEAQKLHQHKLEHDALAKQLGGELDKRLRSHFKTNSSGSSLSKIEERIIKKMEDARAKEELAGNLKKE